MYFGGKNFLYSSIFALVGIHIQTYEKCHGLQLKFSPHQPLLLYANGECANVTWYQGENNSEKVEVRIESSNSRIAAANPDILPENSTGSLLVEICGFDVGQVIITATVYYNKNNDSQAILPVIVFRGHVFQWISNVSSWIYRVCWSSAAFLQIRMNHAYKNVIGLNFNFVALNMAGLLFQLLFTAEKYTSSSAIEVKDQNQLFPEEMCPVTAFDLISSWLAFLGISFICYQCWVYKIKRDGPRISLPVKIFIFFMTFAAILHIVHEKYEDVFHPWHDALHYSSYIILLISIIQYVPQILMNHSRKSTIGWSVGYAKLILLGGIFHITQLIVCSYNYGDWSTIPDNLASLSASISAVVFGAIFIFQHYALYKSAYSNKILMSLSYTELPTFIV